MSAPLAWIALVVWQGVPLILIGLGGVVVAQRLWALRPHKQVDQPRYWRVAVTPVEEVFKYMDYSGWQKKSEASIRVELTNGKKKLLIGTVPLAASDFSAELGRLEEMAAERLARVELEVAA